MLIKARIDTAQPHLREGSTTGESDEVDAVDAVKKTLLYK